MTRKPTLSPPNVHEHLCRRFRRIDAFEQLTEGEESRAFGVTADGQDLVVRISRSRVGFDKDAYAYRHFRSVNVPVPEVLSIEAFETAWLCISVRIPGQTLQALGASAALYAGAIADTIQAIAKTEVPASSGFGPFDADGRATFAHWRDYLAAIADPVHFDWSAVSSLVPPGTVKPLLQRITDLAGYCTDRRQLIHGDFGSNNVLVGSGAVTGVLDWSEAMWGDALYDVANIFFWRTWLSCMEEQAQHFERHSAVLATHADRHVCYQLRIGLQAAHDAAIDGDLDFTRWALERCTTLAFPDRSGH